uniref:Uncharacterized protein n=1 Tax=Cucumis melo TaxID=3656 RepID=A0A9I9ECY0_CUCME
METRKLQQDQRYKNKYDHRIWRKDYVILIKEMDGILMNIDSSSLKGHSSNDVLTQALGTKEHHGCVRGIGGVGIYVLKLVICVGEGSSMALAQSAFHFRGLNPNLEQGIPPSHWPERNLKNECGFMLGRSKLVKTNKMSRVREKKDSGRWELQRLNQLFNSGSVGLKEQDVISGIKRYFDLTKITNNI